MKGSILILLFCFLANISFAQTKIGHKPTPATNPGPSQTRENEEYWINYNHEVKVVGDYLSEKSKDCYKLERGYKLSNTLIKEADKLLLLLANQKESHAEDCKETQFLTCLTKEIIKDGKIYKSLAILATPEAQDPDKVCDLKSDEREVINKLSTDLIRLVDKRSN